MAEISPFGEFRSETCGGSRELRLGNYELLRLLSTFMIVLLHVAAGSISLTMEHPDISFTLSNAMDSATRYAVPLFVMLSGAFQLNKKRNKKYFTYYKKIGITILIPTLVWSFIYVLYQVVNARKSYALGEIDSRGLSDLISYFFTQWVKGAPYYHMWYLYMALGLFVITPILIRVINRLDRGSVGLMGATFLIIGMIVTDITTLPWYLKFIQYLGYYILGYWIRENVSVLKKWKIHSAIISIICMIFIFYATEILVKSGTEAINPFYFYGFLSPVVAFGSVTAFSFFSCLTFENLWVDKIATYSFSIYLVHALILDMLTKAINESSFELGSVMRIPILTLAVFLLSLGFAVLIHVIKGKLLGKLKFKS